MHSSRQFAFFRICLGTYLLHFFVQQIPYATDFYSNLGMFAHLLPNNSYPSVFLFNSSPKFVTFILVTSSVLSVTFIFGFFRQLSALVLLYFWTSLVNQIPVYYSPSDGYIGWLLLACVFVPPGESLGLKKIGIKEKNSDANWQMPKEIYWSAWFVIGLSYTASGLSKIGETSWMNGEAARLTFANPIARDWIVTKAFTRIPDWFSFALTYFTLCLEILFLPACLMSRTRGVFWLMMTGLHLAIFITISISDVSLAMLIVHLFLFDQRWLQDFRDSSFLLRKWLAH